jgi:outer membrane protein OmpA-like peptidoglycan-associated protein
MKLKLLFSTIFLSNIALNIFAQDDFTLFNLNLLPQSSIVNPAIMPNDQIFIGFPALGNISLSAYNTAFSYNDLLGTNGNNLNINNIIKEIPANNYLGLRFNLDLLSIGIRTKKMYFYFSSTEKIETQFRYPGDFLKFAWQGNGDLLGQDLKFNFGLEASHYRTYGLLISRQINPKLIVAAKVSYLYGMENIHTQLSDISLQTNENTFALTAKSNVEINTAGLSRIDIAQKPYTTYNLNKNNGGIGIDLGAKYRITDKISINASIVNWGYINWRDDVKTYKSKFPNASYTFEGINLNQVFSDSSANTDNTLSSIADSAINSFAIVESRQNYKTKLLPRVFIGGSYQLTKKINTSLMFQGVSRDGKMNFGASAGVIFNLEWLDASITYNVQKNSFNNLGVGFSLWPGGTNLFMVTDNILGAIKYKETKSLNVRIGFSIIYGKYYLNDDSDGDLVPDEEDKCPRQAGKKELSGCPDKDGDMVIDSEDDCPGEFGTKVMNGCPDRDGDRIIDRYDECPDVAGEIQFKGCPDRDHDGIRDSEDKCPNDAGTLELNGCPDKDGDGVGDADDACPDKAGTRNNKGCPVDSDGDGVADADDKCPDIAGAKSTDGCPDSDTDGDGVKDSEDSCPVTPGDIENKGCPKLSDSDKSIINEAQSNLTFKDMESEIKPSSYSALESLANWMSSNQSNLILKGHTSNEGSESINLALSKERAESVKKFLEAKNINPTRIMVEFYGSSKPIGDNNTPDGRTKNNRVEFIIGFK